MLFKITVPHLVAKKCFLFISHVGFYVELLHKEKEGIIKSDTCPFYHWKISVKCDVLIHICIRKKKKKQQNYIGI